MEELVLFDGRRGTVPPFSNNALAGVIAYLRTITTVLVGSNAVHTFNCKKFER